MTEKQRKKLVRKIWATFWTAQGQRRCLAEKRAERSDKKGMKSVSSKRI